MLIALLVAATAVAPASSTNAVSPALAERRLYPAEITSSSFLWTDWNQFQENYHPNYIGDDDPKTAWVEGAKGTGAGEWIRIKVTPMEGATKARLSMRNGYQKSDKLFKANGRPEKILVTLLPSKTAKEVTLNDKQGFQDVIVEQPSGALEAIEIKLVSVYPGSKYEDTCISDIDVYATATTHENPAYEKTLFDKLQAWRKARLDAAKLFADKGKGDMPVAAGYSFDTDRPDFPEGGACDYRKPSYPTCSLGKSIGMVRDRKLAKHQAAIAMAEAAVSSGLAGFARVQVVAKDTKPTPVVDNVCVVGFASEPYDCTEALGMPSELGYLRANTIGTFTTTDQLSLDDIGRGDVKPCQSKTPKVFGWVKTVKPESGPERVQMLVRGTCGLVCSRDGLAPAGTIEMYVYDDNGNLELFAWTDGANVYDWSADGKRIAGGTSIWGTAKANDTVATK